MTSLSHTIPSQVGVGLRFRHYEHFLTKRPVPWIEVHPENHRTGVRQKLLEDLRQDYPISAHGIGLSWDRMNRYPKII